MRERSNLQEKIQYVEYDVGFCGEKLEYVELDDSVRKGWLYEKWE